MNRGMTIVLNTVEDVKKFVSDISNIEGEITISSGRYIVDAKSIMGIFSIDLSKPLGLSVENWKDEYEEVLKPYLVENR